MRDLALSVATALVLTSVAGCGDDTCEAAYDKMEGCVAKLNCNRLDPIERERCVKAKSAWSQYSGNRSAYVLACDADSKVKAEAEKVDGCALDPKTCTCP